MLTLFFLVCAITVWAQPASSESTTSYNFKKGEHLEFKLNYGWFTVGKASLDIDSSDHLYRDRDCFKVEARGSTAGLLGVFTHVDDTWGAYLKKENLLPLHSYRNIEEGKYVRRERTDFDHAMGKVEVLRYDPRKVKRKPKRIYDISGEVYDLMGSFLHLRNVDFSTYVPGDTLTINTFYEDELYHFKMVFQGVELFDSKVGELRAYKLKFLMPTSNVFPNEDGVHAWISEDSNQLPLRIEAEMFFGKAFCDLTSYRNLKYGPDYQ